MTDLTSKMKNLGHFTYWVPFLGFSDTIYRYFYSPHKLR